MDDLRRGLSLGIVAELVHGVLALVGGHVATLFDLVRVLATAHVVGPVSGHVRALVDTLVSLAGVAPERVLGLGDHVANTHDISVLEGISDLPESLYLD